MYRGDGDDDGDGCGDNDGEDNDKFNDFFFLFYYNSDLVLILDVMWKERRHPN